MIASNQISVIVQGSINKEETPKCLKSIRRFLPNAEIILSTWNGEDVLGFDFDVLVLNNAPIAPIIEEIKHKTIYNNMNRQLLSTQAGLKKATRKFALKLRSDLILTNNSFLDYFNKFQNRTQNYNLFERKILTSTLFTRFNIKLGKQSERVNMPFHISDWWFFGLREDLNKYFLETPLVTEPDFTNYFNLEENKSKKSPYCSAMFKFAPEQYFGYECFSRNFNDIYMEDCADYNDELMEKFRECLVNNFIVLEFEQSGIYLNKYKYSKNEKFSGDQYIDLYNFYRYECEYKKYCDTNYNITAHSSILDNENIGHALLRIYKHIATLTDENAPISQRLEQLFFGIPISFICYIFIVINEKIRIIK